jgi:hypothetical protein
MKGKGIPNLTHDKLTSELFCGSKINEAKATGCE